VGFIAHMIWVKGSKTRFVFDTGFHSGPANRTKQNTKKLASTCCPPPVRQTCMRAQIYGNGLSIFFFGSKTGHIWTQPLLFGLDKFEFAFLMRLIMSKRACRRCMLRSAMFWWAG